MSKNDCRFCGAELVQGAYGCFQCGKLDEELEGTDGGVIPTQQGTAARQSLLGGTWRLLQPIGSGGVGVVWRAQDVNLDRAVAVKLLHENLSDDKELVARFEREARVLAGLDHANIVPVLGVGATGTQPFLVMKLLEGLNLSELLHRWKGVPAAAVSHLLLQLCDALEYVHAQGVLHRDLKPSNCIVSAEGHLSLMDFGFAREAGSALTQTGQTLGTMQYMAPEQLSREAPVDARADVYSFSCLAYELFSGKKAFDGAPAEVFLAHSSAARPSLLESAPHLHPDIAAVVQAAMAVDPAQRPSLAELKSRLSSAAPPSWPMPNPLQAPPPKSPAPAGPRSSRANLQVQRSSPELKPTRGSNPALAQTRSSKTGLPAQGPTPAVAASGRRSSGAALPSQRPSQPGAVPLPPSQFGARGGDASFEPTDPVARPLAFEPTAPMARPLRDAGPPLFQQTWVRALGGAGVLVVIAVVASVFARPQVQPPPAVKIEGLQPVETVFQGPAHVVETPTVDDLEANGPREQATVTLVAPGKETYRPLNYNRHKRLTPANAVKPVVSPKKMPNNGTELEVRVFEAEGGPEIKASVDIDGVRAGVAPVVKPVRPGEHLIRIADRAHPDTMTIVQVASNTHVRFDIVLRPMGAENFRADQFRNR